VFAHVWSYGLGHSIHDPCAVSMVGVGSPALALGRPNAHRSSLLRGKFLYDSIYFDTCA